MFWLRIAAFLPTVGRTLPAIAGTCPKTAEFGGWLK